MVWFEKGRLIRIKSIERGSSSYILEIQSGKWYSKPGMADRTYKQAMFVNQSRFHDELTPSILDTERTRRVWEDEQRGWDRNEIRNAAGGGGDVVEGMVGTTGFG